jgi:hypothetical protein
MHYPVRLSFGGRKYRGFWVVNRAAPYALLLLLFIENYLEQFKLMGSFLDSEGKRVLKVVGFIGGEEAQPHDTYFLMALWVWCGIVWACTPRGSKQISNAWGVGPAPEVVELPADVGGGHQGFAHQYGADAGRLQA